ncbi:1-acyl-sn-glycerol-3-phosphate acyltransferase [Salibacteraceae bacterium]|nr:1-acyl-sn-glycerol-3-phosphate acyltransferase [Salibacteraceae bacterium]
MKTLARFIVKISGWKVEGHFGPELKNCIIIVAPHTSQWDFIFGMLARTIYGIKAKYLIKNSFFKPGISWFFHMTGGIAVDRSKKNELTDHLKEMLGRGEELKITFTPEGTRKRVDRWRTGFYWTAIDTGLPIVAHYIDYKHKVVGQFPPFVPTGDWEADKVHFEKLYADVNACHDSDFNRSF